MVNGEKRRWFVWGVEIWLPEGGRDGYSGSLDLIATDEAGLVWLVEAKLRTNPELCPDIWKKQLLPYRYGLARLTPDIINRRSRRYLLNQGAHWTGRCTVMLLPMTEITLETQGNRKISRRRGPFWKVY